MTRGVQRDQGRSEPDGRAMDQGMRALSYLISGVLLYGGLGWVGFLLLRTSFLLPIGIVLGAAFGIYSMIRRLAVTDGLGRPDATTATKKEGDQ